MSNPRSVLDEEFVDGLSEMKKAKEEQAIEVLYRLFRSINLMSVEEVVAARQLITLLERTSTLSETQKQVTEELADALYGRAKAIVESIPLDEREGKDKVRWLLLNGFPTDKNPAGFF